MQKDTRNIERYMQGYSNDQGASDYGDATSGGNGSQVSADDPSANYMGPEQGPFSCSNCTYFVSDGQPCQKVSDPVQSDGCCDLFSKGASQGSQAQPQAQPQPKASPLPRPGAI